VKHNSIGVGLNCSKVITEFLGGELKFITSQPGDTSIRVTIPV
jgi:signal transduction histidine kinase